MLQKSGICICLLVTVAADWVQIPVLDPRKLESSNLGEQNSYLTSSPNSLPPPSSSIHNSAQPNSASEVIEVTPIENKHVLANQLQNNKLISHKNVGETNSSTNTDKEIILYPNKEIDPNFLLSVMNNSQKTDRIALENTESESKVNPFLDVLKNVHHTLLKGIPMTIIGKMKFLQDLQTKLYSYIKPRIKRLWIIEERQARMGMDKGMGFPSMDGALMTISFLLFAVFLIKLVKQLIQQLQEKANANALMMTGATPVVPAVPAPVANIGRRKRSPSEETIAAAHILHLIESFQVQYSKLASPQ